MKYDTFLRLGALSDHDYRQLSNEIVSRYRRVEEQQELIAVALSRATHSASDHLTRSRIDEILSMLDHVHDPLIH